MIKNRTSKIIDSTIGLALILSMVVTPLAPQGHIVTAASDQIQSGQAAFDFDPADLLFTNTASVVGGKPRAEAGDTLRYTMTLTNNGTTDIQGMVLQDPLGSNLNLVPGSVEATPLAYDQSLTTLEDTPLDLTLTGSDGDGDPLVFNVTVDPVHGDLSGTAPNLTYMPDPDYVGSDSVTFTVNDGNVDSQPATISIQVNSSNDAPICSAVSITTAEDTIGNTLPDCSDVDLDLLTYQIESQPANGSAAVVDGKLSYTPASNFFGTDSFEYSASDGLNDSNIAVASVTVTSVNDAPIADPQTLTTNEDTDLAITLTGVDVDSDPLTFSIIDQPLYGSLTGSAPDLIYTPGTDYNGADSLSFRVCDNAPIPLCDNDTVDLTVLAVNDAPSFTLGPDQTVLEDSGSTTVSGWATALSAGPANEAGQALSFQVLGNTNPGLFSVEPTLSSTGSLTFTPAANANGIASITLRLEDDGGTSGGGIDYSPSQTFKITVNEANDAPVVQADSFSLDENSANGTAVGTVTFTDLENSQTHTFAISSGNTGNAFTVNSSTGVISVANSAMLDFETTPTFTLTIQVTDDGTPMLSGSNTIAIHLNDLEESPTVNSAAFDLNENSANGTSVGIVTVGNKDVGQNHTFTISSGNTGEAFAINSTTGEISVANNAALDFETHPIFTLTVMVSDDYVPANSDTNTVIVNLKNINEAPQVNSADFNLDENSVNGTSLGSVTFADPDAGQTHTFSITAGNTGTAFAINPTNGSLTVSNSAALDYEANSSFNLAIEVTDDGGLTGTASITININDINEAPVVNAASFSVAENSASGVTIGTATFTDQDAGQTHTFAITGGNSGGTFTIHSTSGVISVASSALLDFETTPSFSLTVEVTDNSGLADTASITINLTDVNEAPLVNAAILNIDENSANGAAILPGPVTYIDPDSGQTHVFSITAGNSSGAFSINGTTGVISVANGTLLNYETLTSYTLTVRVTDDGSPALDGTATIIIRVNNVEEAPVVQGETYETIGNTLLEVSDGLAGAAPRIFVSGNILSNDFDPDNAGSLTAGLVSSTTTQGGTVAINSDGSFTYLPPAGIQGADSFTYTVTDTGNSTTTGTVNITIRSMVWYVKNNAPASGSGRSTSPFNTLVAAQTASGAGSTIYIYPGDGTTSGQAAGITLKSGQRLIGAGVALDMPVQVNGGALTTNLLPAATQPLIDNINSGGNGVTAVDSTNVEIRGLNLAGAVNAINISATGTNSGMVTIQNNTVRSSGEAGIKIQSDSTGTLNASILSNTLTATGNGFDAQNARAGSLIIQFTGNTISATADAVVINNAASGNTTVTAFKDNNVAPNTAGSGIVITSAVFDATPGGAYQVVDAGNTLIGAAGNGVGGAGMNLTNVRGDLSFTDLDIFADNGAGLRATSTAAFNASSGTGFKLTVTAGAGSLTAVGGPALDVNAATLDLQLANLTTTNSPTTGVSLAYVSGTVSATTGSINNASGTDFNVNGGNANITYGGSIANSTGKAVSVTLHTGGIVAFTGAITGTASGDGIFLNSNSGATINFSGGLTLSTGSNPAFTATSGGTVNVTGTANTLTTTSATALNVTNTTIGSSGLIFRSISANGAANAIVLNTTGSSGGLTITGTGSAGSGGTMQNITADCVLLTNTTGIEFNRVNIQNCGGTGINATLVNGFKFKDGRVDNAGNANGEHGMRFNELAGLALIQDTTISNISEDGILLTNTSGLLNMTVRRTAISLNNTTYGEDGFQMQLSAAATAKILVEASTFTSLQRDGIDGAVQGDSTLDLTINNNQFTGNLGNGGVNLSSNNTADTRLNLTNNIFNNNVDTPVNLVSMGNSTFNGRVNNNTITNPTTPPLVNHGLHLEQEENSIMTVEVNANTIQNTNLNGFEAIARMATGVGIMNLTMRNNTIQAPISVSGDVGAYLAAGNSADPINNTNTICLDMGYTGVPGGNTINGSTGYSGVSLIQRTGSTFQVEGWNTALQSTLAAHIQAFNSPTTAQSSGTFTAIGAGSCPMPVDAGLPAAVALLTDSGSIMAHDPSLSTSSVSLVRFTPATAVKAGDPETVSVNVGTLPAGKTVTITFDVAIGDPLPEDMLKVTNQAVVTSSSFVGEILSDDPATLAQPDATESILYRSPVAHDDTYSMVEDTSINVDPAGVLNNDTTAIGYETLLSAVKDNDPASGTLVFNTDGSFTFTPSVNFNGTASFDYHADDTQSESNTAVVNITVTPVNDAPVLDNLGNFSLLPISQRAVNNPGTLVSAIIASAGGDPIQDVDSDALEGLAITGVNTIHGYWQYTIDNGSNWLDFSTPSESAARLLAADANTRVRFVPDQTWNGTIDPGISFYAWDLTSGTNGGTLDIHAVETQTAFSADLATANITIDGNNDLSLTMTSPTSQVMAGTRLNYTLTLANAGPADATSVVVTDTLPAGATFDSASPQCHALDRTVTCSIASLEAGNNITLTISTVIDTGIRGMLTNTAQATSIETDEDLSNNEASSSVEVVSGIVAYSLGDHPGDEWNRPVITTSPNGTQFLGEFGNETVTLLLNNLPTHTQAIITFDLYIIRSWDGNTVNIPENIPEFQLMGINPVGPDHWRLDADGSNLLNTTFANWANPVFHQAYPENYPGGSYPPQTGATSISSLGYVSKGYGPLDSTYHFNYPINHDGTSLKVEFTGSGLQELADESWGLANVQIVLTAGADTYPYKLFFPAIGQ